MKAAVEHLFTGLTATVYDSAKTTLGHALIQQRTGATALDKFLGPMPVGIARPMEASTAIQVSYPFVVPWSSTVDLVFLAGAAAGTNRQVVLYEYDKTTSVFTWKGFITPTTPSGATGNQTVRTLRVTRDLHTAGTCSASGTAVTGSGTSFSAGKVSVGARIGFGTTDPTQVSTWYEITAVNSDTSLTIGADAGTVSGGAYVVEELRVILVTTCATAANWGVFLVKGLHPGVWQPGGTTISASTENTDGLRRCYWLQDSGNLCQTACGAGLEDKVDASTQYLWVVNGTSNPRLFKFNVREALTLSGGTGKATNTDELKTATLAVTGTLPQTSNGRVATTAHGAGSGLSCFYFVTTTRIYRTIALSSIAEGHSSWIADNQAEIPPGGTTTFAATSALGCIEYADTIDRFYVMTGATGRAYLTQYDSPFGDIFLTETRELHQTTASDEIVPHPNIGALTMQAWSEGGVLYLCRNGTAASNNHLYALAGIMDWSYVSTASGYAITPAINVPNVTKFVRVLVQDARYYGGTRLGHPAEPYRVYARTSGISDNSGGWTLLSDTGDLSSFGAASTIQFKFEFKTLGDCCLPARIYGLAVLYETSDYLPSELEWTLADSSNADGTVGFTQVASFGSVPVLEINYYRSDTDALVLTQTSATTTNGTFQYHDGATWQAGVGSDVVGTRRRFVPSAGLPAGVNLYAKISVV